jgi:hypothetical protein
MNSSATYACSADGGEGLLRLAEKPIQEQFGQQIIDAFADFARADLKPPSDLEQAEFSHVTDVALRRRLAEVFYGVRWIYKLGLALLTEDTERAAHVRAQIVDYASVSEALLSDCLAHAMRNGHIVGIAHTFKDPDRQRQPMAWNLGNPEPRLRKQTFWWMIRIAHEFGVINRNLAADLNWLRRERNAVHLQGAFGKKAYLNHSRTAFNVVRRTIRQTKAWKAAHP